MRVLLHDVMKVHPDGYRESDVTMLKKGLKTVT